MDANTLAFYYFVYIYLRPYFLFIKESSYSVCTLHNAMKEKNLCALLIFIAIF